MSLPPGYPQDLPDEEVLKVMRSFASALSPNINDVMRSAPLVEIGQAELQIRASRQLREAIEDFKTSSERASEDLRHAVDSLRVSSKRAADRLWNLTWALVALTACLLGVTIALIVTA